MPLMSVMWPQYAILSKMLFAARPPCVNPGRKMAGVEFSPRHVVTEILSSVCGKGSIQLLSHKHKHSEMRAAAGSKIQHPRNLA